MKGWSYRRMEKKTTKCMLEFVVEIERIPYTDKESWFKAMKAFQVMHSCASERGVFEVFEDADTRRAVIAKNQNRMMHISIENTIPGAKITEFDLDEEGDLYYAKIRVPDNPEARGRINMGKGKFIPRLLAHTETCIEDGKKKQIAKVNVMICLDFVWKKGENVDEDQSGSKEHDGEGCVRNETPDAIGAGGEA